MGARGQGVICRGRDDGILVTPQAARHTQPPPHRSEIVVIQSRLGNGTVHQPSRTVLNENAFTYSCGTKTGEKRKRVAERGCKKVPRDFTLACAGKKKPPHALTDYPTTSEKPSLLYHFHTLKNTALFLFCNTPGTLKKGSNASWPPATWHRYSRK